MSMLEQGNAKTSHTYSLTVAMSSIRMMSTGAQSLSCLPGLEATLQFTYLNVQSEASESSHNTLGPMRPSSIGLILAR